MKRIISMLLVVATLLIVCSCSCVRGDSKYDYKDLTKYIKLPNYKSHSFEIEEDSLKQAIGTYLMEKSATYTIKRGDKINVDIKFYENLDQNGQEKGTEYTDYFKDDLWIDNVGTPSKDGGYQVSHQIENSMIGTKIGDSIEKKYVLADDFYIEELRGKNVVVEFIINNRQAEEGDVIIASYTGYYLDDDGNILKEEGKDKTFDASDKSVFYIGSHLAIDDFEKGLIGMSVGVEKDIYATFPDDYEPSKDFAGKKVMFRTKIKSFHTPPIYNDAFVKAYFVGFNNTKEFEEALKKEYILTTVYEYIAAHVEVIEYPKAEYKAAEKQLEEIEGPFAANMNMTLDKYIETTYNKTREEYIKENMKTEMIFYSLRNIIGAAVEPTESELKAARENLIMDYKNDYMKNEGLNESAALSEARRVVESLGEAYLYENVLYSKIDEVVVTQVDVKIIPAKNSYIFDAQEQ